MPLRSEHYAVLLIWFVVGIIFLIVLGMNYNLFQSNTIYQYLNASFGVFIIPMVLLIVMIIIVPRAKNLYGHLTNSVQNALFMPLRGASILHFLLWTLFVSSSISSMIYVDDQSLLRDTIIPDKISKQIPSLDDLLYAGDFKLFLVQFGVPAASSLFIGTYRLAHVKEIQEISSLLNNENNSKKEISEIRKGSSSFTNFIITVIVIGLVVYAYGIYSVPGVDVDIIKKILIVPVWMFSLLNSLVITGVMTLVDRHLSTR